MHDAPLWLVGKPLANNLILGIAKALRIDARHLVMLFKCNFGQTLPGCDLFLD